MDGMTSDDTAIETDNSKRARGWFEDIGQQLCDSFERLETLHANETGRPESAGSFTTRKTSRTSRFNEDAGGGTMRSLRGGAVFEKVSVNVSTVHGCLNKKLIELFAARRDVSGIAAGSGFWASGVSMVAHLNNPKAPAGHFNTRLFITSGGWWFGGSADLNPCLEFSSDTDRFHFALKQACDRYEDGSYDEYSKWADRYFNIPHRGRARGVGGIFFDDLCSGDWDRDFGFVREVGVTFLESYTGILRQRRSEPWSEADRRTQLLHRGLYVEFNLLYDRGTRFGLESGHDADAVLMSMPPVAEWR